MTTFHVDGLSAGYGNVTVLRDISFAVDPGQVVVLVGANGAGKTTVLRALSGTIWRRGSVRLGEHELVGLDPGQVVRRGIAHVPQGRGTFGRLTVEENLAVAGSWRGRKDASRSQAEVMAQFPVLAERRHQVAAALSGGEQQMLAIGRALMLAPSVLLLDEPSLGLAPLITKQVFEIVDDIRRRSGMSVVVVEQNAELSMEIADHVVVLEHGSIVTSGSASQVRSSDAIRRAYLGAGAR